MSTVLLTNEADNQILGSTQDAVYYGLDGNDLIKVNFAISLSTSIYGGEGNDVLTASAANDFLYGDSGDDAVYGMAGGDRLYGGEGDDKLYGDYEQSPYTGVGKDILYGGEGKDTLAGGGQADTLNGDGGNDIIYGDRTSFGSISKSPGGDRIYGGDGGDQLFGQDGNDTISGDAGADKLIGGNGADTLIGGLGADHFIYQATSDSKNGGADTILDFRHSEHDLIDVSAIDARSDANGDQHFSYIGSAAFGHVSGQLRFSDGVLQGDTNGDGVADFTVKVAGISSLVGGDFIL